VIEYLPDRILCSTSSGLSLPAMYSLAKRILRTAPVCTVTRGHRGPGRNRFDRYSLFFLSLRTVGYRSEQCSGGRPLLLTHGEKTTALAKNWRNIAEFFGDFAVDSNNRIQGRELWRRNGGESVSQSH
jgi:hypothetical protein